MKVAIGRFGRPHGVRGEIRFWPFNRTSRLLEAKKIIEVGSNREHLEKLQLDTIRFDSKGALCRFKGIADRDIVSRLTNLLWFEERDAFPPLADDEVYFTDLIGLVVKTLDGEHVGCVKDVLDSGPAELFVIDRNGREVMLPNVAEFIVKMDLEGGEMIVTPPTGLIDGIGD
ncbi:MAG: 16S rRNA processing protein RimM [Myxococcales bacterium]|nr:16S rRNA processing protein RimM [Myxococcales bacterium]|tara:strand:- start:334 stop:849 length:516 start_codon:yes stop_codon:yes gene_type:complete